MRYILLLFALVCFLDIAEANDSIPKYPYIERVEIGYKIRPFEFSDSIMLYEENKALKAQKDKEYKEYKANMLSSLVVAVCLYIFAIFMIVLVLLVLSSIIVMLANFQNKYAKKR